MQPLSRRRAIQLGGLGLASIVVGAVGLTWKSTSGFRVAPSAALVEPPVLASTDGLLQTRLEAARGPVRIAGRRANALSYNGGLPGPTLHLKPGDRLRIQLVNRLNDPTNLHVHGLHVSPDGNGTSEDGKIDIDCGSGVASRIADRQIIVYRLLSGLMYSRRFDRLFSEADSHRPVRRPAPRWRARSSTGPTATIRCSRPRGRPAPRTTATTRAPIATAPTTTATTPSRR